MIGILESKKRSQSGTAINTYIGNVADIYPDKATLASVLNITENDIPVFDKVGNNIECRIETNYAIPNGFGYPNIKYYIDDIDGMATYHGGFINNDNCLIETIRCKNVVTIAARFISGSQQLKEISFPNLPSAPNNGFAGFQFPQNVELIDISSAEPSLEILQVVIRYFRLLILM